MMAKIKVRKRADGSTAYTVHWVIGGGDDKAGVERGSETVNSENTARASSSTSRTRATSGLSVRSGERATSSTSLNWSPSYRPWMMPPSARWGEASALRASDVSDGEDGDVYLHIQRAWGRRAPGDPMPINWALGESKKYRLKDPKSGGGRYVVVSGGVATRLRARAGDAAPGDYLFGRQGPWRYEDARYEIWHRGLRVLELSP